MTLNVNGTLIHAPIDDRKCRKLVEHDQKPVPYKSRKVYVFLKEEIFICQKIYTFLDLFRPFFRMSGSQLDI